MKNRQWETGANRNTNEGKLEFARFLSPLVLKRYCEYMDKHRLLENGDYREPDNWKNLFGENHDQVCIDSLARHFLDLWVATEGGKGREDRQDTLCAIMFNAMAILYKELKEKQDNGL
jgi:hypothetical protein